ncbi:hypothetical protein CEXT_626341 [Caerostris extrusa]|uniref:Uncharacterized protein n=1 Tax=Caerostris extrusa TaxID=172846 RepID=A0AAV4W7D7_CAEEX|nr:hypothetical protein CEXT_626341 [Caerostris extrusa]
MHGDKLARIRISFIFRKCNKPVLNLINPAEDSFQEEFFDPISPYSAPFGRELEGVLCPFIRFPHPIPLSSTDGDSNRGSWIVQRCLYAYPRDLWPLKRKEPPPSRKSAFSGQVTYGILSSVGRPS